MKTLILSLLGSAMLLSTPALAGDDYVPEAADPAADAPYADDDRHRSADGASAGERGYDDDDDDDDDDDRPGRMDDRDDDDDDD